MRTRKRIVVDTGVLISRLLVPRSVPGQAVSWAVNNGQLLASEATLNELADVISRSKFDSYVTVSERQEFLRLLVRVIDMVPIVHRIQVCRDSKDDKFLELAVNGEADAMVSGDKDLRVLHPFRGVPILTPKEFTQLLEQWNSE